MEAFATLGIKKQELRELPIQLSPYGLIVQKFVAILDASEEPRDVDSHLDNNCLSTKRSVLQLEADSVAYSVPVPEKNSSSRSVSSVKESRICAIQSGRDFYMPSCCEKLISK